MKRGKKTFEIEYNVFDVGEKVMPLTVRDNMLQRRVYTVEQFQAPQKFGMPAVVILKGIGHAIMASDLVSLSSGAPSNDVFDAAPLGSQLRWCDTIYRKVSAREPCSGDYEPQLLNEKTWSVERLSEVCPLHEPGLQFVWPEDDSQLKETS